MYVSTDRIADKTRQSKGFFAPVSVESTLFLTKSRHLPWEFILVVASASPARWNCHLSKNVGEGDDGLLVSVAFFERSPVALIGGLLQPCGFQLPASG